MSDFLYELRQVFESLLFRAIVLVVVIAMVLPMGVVAGRQYERSFGHGQNTSSVDGSPVRAYYTGVYDLCVVLDQNAYHKTADESVTDCNALVTHVYAKDWHKTPPAGFTWPPAQESP